MVSSFRIRCVAILVVVGLTCMPVEAFLPSKSKQFLGPLFSTMEEEEQKQLGLRQQMPPSELSKVSPNVHIKIAPLGTNPKFGASDPLKEFPSFLMKERLHKIRSPRKKPNEVIPVEGRDNELLPEPKLDPAVSCPPLLFGNGEFFATEELTQIVHENADVGSPLESYRTLADKIPLEERDMDFVASCGSASCSPGGWPSKTPTPTTQIFYTLDGFGCLTDMDGKRHYFGPGDTVLVPKNWAGRWDVAENLHKIWFTLDEKEVKKETVDNEGEKDDADDDTLPIVRAKVIHYHELVKWSFPYTSEIEDAIVNNEDPHKSETTFATVEDFGLGLSCFTCFSPSTTETTETASVPISIQPRKFVDCFHILEGALVLTPVGTGEPSFEFSTGDTVVLPKGWAGYCEIQEPIKALRVRA